MDEDELAELAELYGVDPEDVADYLEAAGEDVWEDIREEVEGAGDMTGAELADYLESLAEAWDVDVHDLYEMYYGYEP